MEYTSKNSPGEKAITVILHPYSLVIQRPEGEVVIPYASVLSVQLFKTRRGLYKTFVRIDNHPPLLITNKYVLPNGESQDQSRSYATFVRVLHFHLKDKSSASFASGVSFTNLLFWAAATAFVSFIISFVSEYVGISLLNPFVQAVIMTAAVISLIVVFNRRQFPKMYSPANIPLQFLP